MEEYTEFNIEELRGGYRADEDGITLWKGNYLTREAESRLSWDEARFLVYSYIEDGVYLLPREEAEKIETNGMYQQLDLFTMFTEQAGNLAVKQAEEAMPIQPVAKIPPEQLADIIRSGGGRDNSRKRIYAKYQQGKTPEEMTAFLQKEYGTTGKGFEFNGKQLAVWSMRAVCVWDTAHRRNIRCSDELAGGRSPNTVTGGKRHLYGCK